MTNDATPAIPVYRQQACQARADRLDQARKRYPRIGRTWSERVCLVSLEQRLGKVGPGKRGRPQ